MAIGYDKLVLEKAVVAVGENPDDAALATSGCVWISCKKSMSYKSRYEI